MKNHLQPRFKRANKAFTLIELLVVIAIIAILAAILFPVFARARENARRASCQSNLKQVGLGILQYNQDYDEKYPFACYDTAAGEQPWQYTIQPYVKSVQLFKCPSSSSNNTVSSSSVNGSPAIPVSYLCNGGGSYSNPADFGTNAQRPMNRAPGGGGSYPVSGGASIAQLNSSSQTILVMEQNGNTGNADLYNAGDLSATNTPFQNHLGTTNFLWADGHVKALKPTATIAGGVNQWSTDPTNTSIGTVLKTALESEQARLQ